MDINQWEKIVADEIREQSANMAHPNVAGPTLLIEDCGKLQLVLNKKYMKSNLNKNKMKMTHFQMKSSLLYDVDFRVTDSMFKLFTYFKDLTCLDPTIPGVYVLALVILVSMFTSILNFNFDLILAGVNILHYSQIIHLGKVFNLSNFWVEFLVL